MPRLHELIAIEKGAKAAERAVSTEHYHLLQKEDLLKGLERTYQPKEDDGDRLPPESSRVRVRAADSIAAVQSALSELMDVTFARESANCQAAADVTLDDGTVLLAAAPVSYLLFLEKRLVDIRTFVSKLPTLDLADEWTFDDQNGLYATDAVATIRTKKVPRVLVKAAATDKHPAQTEVYYEDIAAGTWTSRKFSGALPSAAVRAMTERVEAVQRAVKVARERANATDAPAPKGIAQPLLDYIFSTT
jgi:hypothetical protein